MTGYPELIALIKANPAWASLSDADCATAVVAVPVPAPTQMVFGSFRTLAAILPQQDYNVLRGALTAAATAEAAAGGSYINDAIAMLRLPGDQQGNGGGLNFGDPGFVSNLTTLCAQANLPNVAGLVAAWVASLQPPPTYPYAWVQAGNVNSARSMIAGGA